MSILQSANGSTSVSLTGVAAGSHLVAFLFNPSSGGFADQSISDDQDNLWTELFFGAVSNRRIELWLAEAVSGGNYVFTHSGANGNKLFTVFEVSGSLTVNSDHNAKNETNLSTIPCAEPTVTDSGNLFVLAGGIIRFGFSSATPGTGFSTELSSTDGRFVQSQLFPTGVSADDFSFSVSPAGWSVGAAIVFYAPDAPSSAESQSTGVPFA